MQKLNLSRSRELSKRAHNINASFRRTIIIMLRIIIPGKGKQNCTANQKREETN